MKARILVALPDGLRHLASYALEEDGSFYVWLVREGTNDHTILSTPDSVALERVDFLKPQPKTKKVSYHASGLLRFHETEHRNIFLEPLCSVTAVNSFLAYAVPRLSMLDNSGDAGLHDFVIDFAADLPAQFVFSVAPWNYVPDSTHGALRFEGLFALIIEISIGPIEIKEGLENRFITVVPSPGLPALMLDEPTAFAQFHQLRNQTRDLILYSPNVDGVYRIVCAVPMRIPPTLEVQFVDPSHVVEQLAPHPKRGTVEVKF